jgi:hypothetical protein
MVALLNEIRSNPAPDAETRIAGLVKAITTAETECFTCVREKIALGNV